MAYTVLFADSVLEFIDEHVTSERVFARIETYADLLAHHPYIGASYDPVCEAARPPVPCRYVPVPDTPFTLYYAADDDAQVVNVFYLDCSAAEPQRRFALT